MHADSFPTHTQLNDFKATAVEAATIAGKILLEYARNGFRIEYKNAVNLVTDADRTSEQAIIETIRRNYPNHDILAEERGMESTGRSPYKWVIDPLDGTTNFAHGFPMYCVSIGLEHEGRMVVGVILDPTRQELFAAVSGQGATLNGQCIRVSHTSALDAALLVTGFAYDIRESTNNNLGYFSHFCLRARGVRRTGSAALDLCYVAAGRFDGFWEMKLHAWDVAAGSLMVTEAGGRMSDFKGGAFSIDGEEMVASNGLIHREMLDALRNASPPSRTQERLSH
ncbi:MAG: inositol monophosphatase [Nitrospirales bacterium]|nr:inositol monophosphatase [Nitrospirales bacterium]